MSETDVRRDIWRRMRHDPRLYLRNRWRHPGRPEDKYDFRTTEERRPLHYLVDDRGPLNPAEWGNINVLLMARGCLKTTTVLGITQWGVDTYAVETFMTAPRQAQVGEFMDKFVNAVEDTPLEDRRERNRRSHQKFKKTLTDEHGESYTAFSHVKAKSAWDADEGMRGPHSNIGIVDEFQDVDEDAFSVFLEIIDQNVAEVDYFPVIFIIGTPKLRNTFFEDLWSTSNQRTWIADEPVSEHADVDDYRRDDGWWVEQDDVGQYAPPQSCDVCGFEMSISSGREVCPECGTPVDFSEIPSFSVKGWHIDQYNSPLEAHSEDKIAFKKEKYSEKKFKNEVLAQFYTPEDDLLTEDAIRASFVDEGFRNSRKYDDSTVVLSVDWGGGQSENASDTVFLAGEKVKTGDDDEEYEISILNINFLDRSLSQNEELERVEEWISRYEPDKVVVDEGHSGSRRDDLQDLYDEQLVTGAQFGNVTPSEALRWRQDERDRDVAVTIDKSYSCEKMVDAVNDSKFAIPKNDLNFGAKAANGTKLINHLTATYKEYDTTPSGSKKLKVKSDRNDDAFDTFVFQWLGAVRLQSSSTLTTVGLNRRF